jgi:glucose-6-phosphate 1-dehydrogenase
LKVLGITRKTNLNITEILNKDIPKEYKTNHEEIFYMDVNDKKEYKNLTNKIKDIENHWQEKAEIIFYLSLPPLISTKIIKKIGENDFIQKRKVKILIEKPFGIDLKSAKTQIKDTLKYFKENQIYRVDHYLFKKIVSKIISFKEENEINNKNIESIEVNAFEEIDVGKRILFYEKVGAIKDMMQSHLLELTALILTDSKDNKNGSQNRFNILKNLEIIKEKTIKGQYEGYINKDINPNSQTETFASIALKSKSKNLNKILITLNTGKALNKKETYIKIKYKNKKHIFIREIINKKHNSYENVILNAIYSRKDYFVSQKEVLETWRIINPVISKNKIKLFGYKKGTNIDKIKPQ